MQFLLFVTVACAALVGISHAKESEEHGTPDLHDHKKRTDKHYNADGEHDDAFDHEAVLGSRGAAEEFDNLSPEESKKRLRVLATKTIDEDGDGFVTTEELTAHITKNLKSLDTEEVEERFTEMDTDHDNKITWNEYLVDAFGEDAVDEEQKLNIEPEDERLMDEDKRYFSAADRDGDGILTKEEFAAFQNPEGYDFMVPSLVETTLKEKDLDKDGYLSLKEFLMPNPDSEADWVQSEKTRFEEEYDQNKDGQLDKEEMKKWLVPDLAKTAADEAEHLINGADTNMDGKLSIDEIVDNHETFVGSEATNYGEALEKITHEEL